MITTGFAFLLVLIVATLSSHGPKALTLEKPPTPCVVGSTAAGVGFWMWPANSHVNIYLREPDFSLADVSAISVAVQNWDHTLMENGFNVRFYFHGLTRETMTARGDLTIIRGAVYKKKLRHLALLEAHSLRNDQLIDFALIIVDAQVKDPDVLTNVMAHELGHSLGLLDCYRCRGRSTAMGLLRSADESNGIEGPTACDKNAVVAAYQELKLHVRAAPASLALNQDLMDEGEEPEDDDTPITP
jgi:hypothetical protein